MGRERWLVIAAFATTYLVWGSTYLVNYWAIDTIPPFGMGGCRFLAAGALMYGYSWLAGDRRRPTLRQWGNATLMGILFLAVGVGAVVWAQQWIPTSTAALIIAFEPLVVMCLMWASLRSRPPARAFFGAAISICGMLLLVGQPESLIVPGTDPAGTVFALLAIAAAMLCWGAGMLLRPRSDLTDNPVRGTGMQMLTGGAVLLLFSFLIDEWAGWSVGQVSLRSALSWGFLVVFGSILAFSAFNYLLARVSADKVATNTYVNPVVAVLVGGLLNNEIITGQSLLAGAVLLTGVWFINSSHRERTPSPSVAGNPRK